MTDSTRTAMPMTAKVCILAYILVGFAVAGFVGMSNGRLGFGRPELLLILSALVCASWLRPIMMFSDGSSQAHHMDEGFFVLMCLLLPPAGAVIAFVVATSLAQMIRRRAAVKSIFNVSQIVLSTSCGLLAARLIAPPRGDITLAQLGAAAVGAGVYFVVNSLSLAVILSMTGSSSIRSALFDGLEVRGRMLGGSVSLGLVSAVALRDVPFSAPIIVLPFIAFRQALSGHFQARHDRGRLLGLFDATLAVNHTMGTKDVEDALRKSAASLLRGRDASIASTEPPAGAPVMAVPLEVAGRTRWLTVNGRNRSEPFDAADRALLEALAATGSAALENSSLYEERRREEERLVAITSSLDEGVCAFDSAGRLTFMNPAAEELLGVREEEAIGADSETSELEPLTSAALRSLRDGEHMKDERTVFGRRGGGTFPVEVTCSPIVSEGAVSGAVLAFRDISERLAAEEQLEFHAFHDALTTLPNRTIFLDRLQHALRSASRTGETHAVLFADVDRFKLTNDSLGHHAGDELLVCIANRLRPIIREGDTLARFGGDEFTILLENVGGVEAAEALATRILEAVRRPITLDDGRIILASLSIGIALATAGTNADDVLHDADVAMYQAKHRGTGLYQTFDAVAMGNRSAEWLDLEIALRRAIENEELTVHYQPIVATDSGRIVGAEALVRWEHPKRGTLPPSDFIGLAEETGLILPIGRRVLEQACSQAKEWSENGMPISVAVNLSPRQFQQHDLGRDVRAVLADTGLAPNRLCLEITESLAMADIDRTIHLLVDLKYLGVRLAIDDFGTGYSSLNYLKRFPIDIVKLDRSFVQELDVSTVDTAIVSAVVNLAEAAGMTTVAEGVETPEQLARLIGMGCPMVQGYHLAKPMTAEALTALLNKYRAGRGMDLVALQERAGTGGGTAEDKRIVAGSAVASLAPAPASAAS